MASVKIRKATNAKTFLFFWTDFENLPAFLLTDLTASGQTFDDKESGFFAAIFIAAKFVFVYNLSGL